ncbi:S8 family peptidase [Sphingomonas sp. ASV193]|uniref:S8 family peptidase n=1 Tax=Sphingomonas sp. ASV193 TaxID=3144405 RepID=UPI0032E85748
MEYRDSNAAVSSNAISAWQAGATGAGIKIGIVDSGINTSLAEFAGRIDPASGDVAGTRALADEAGHGTGVASTAAAARNGAHEVGVAFNATIVMERADAPGTCADTTGTDPGCQFYDNAIAKGITAAANAGARVINLSLGGDAPGQVVISAINAAVAKGIVIVVSAGNDGPTANSGNPDAFGAGLAAAAPNSVIIAGALDQSLTQMASFSNLAGTSSASYLTALGDSVVAISNDGKDYYWSGTSFSAPIITGAVALLAQAFPNLTGQQIVSILYQSADDLGAAGVDSTFGHGRLNITKAFQPIGATSLAGSQTPVSLTQSTGTLPSAAGDAASAAGRQMGAIILDGYSRAFTMDFAKRLTAARAAKPLSAALGGNIRTNAVAAGPVAVSVSVTDNRADLAPLHIGEQDAYRSRLVAAQAVTRLDPKTQVAFGFGSSAKAIERKLTGAEGGAFLVARDSNATNGFAARPTQAVAARRELGQGFAMSFSAEQGRAIDQQYADGLSHRYSLTGATIDKSFGRSSWGSLGIQRLQEHDTLLGGKLGGLLGGGGGASTLFVDGELRHDFGSGVSAAVQARRGWTRFNGGAFQTDAYAFDLAKVGIRNDSDRIGLRISQPLRVASGGLALTLPTGWSYDTMTPTYSLDTMSLTPSGREVDAELSYATAFGRGWLSGNLFARRDPGHVAGLAPDLGAAIRYSFGF